MNETYSQHGEDEALSRIFQGNLGVCVEVGANDGVTFSNTYYFEKLGWRSILVEPNPSLCREIRLKRGTGTTLFECAASSCNGTATLNMGSGSEDLFSSLEPIESGTLNRSFVGVTVLTRTLDSILEEAGASRIDFASIDVEGHEMQVLGGFDLARWRPRIVLVEDNTNALGDGVCEHMARAGYRRFYRTGPNDWYIPSGERRLKLLTLLVTSGRFDWRGFIKIVFPRWVIRPALFFHQWFAFKRNRRQTCVTKNG
jgi:FkbM family methyltransferase